MKIILKILLIIFFLSSYSLAEIVKNIEVYGNKRISKESIIVFGDIKYDTNYSDIELNDILKKIYETNFFNKIDLSIDNSVLKITVKENPIIENLEIIGIKSKTLTGLLLDKVKLKSRKSYNEASFLSDINLVKNIIKANGYYFAEVKTGSIFNDVQNSIRLTYDISLGKRAKLNEIQFLGDKKIKDRKLKNVITSEEKKFWKFLSQSVFLNNERIEMDKRLLLNYYKNNGYYNVKINNSFVELKDNSSFKLIFNIEAGEKFTFDNLNLVLADDYDPKYFEKITKSLNKLNGKEYSLNKIEKILREIDKIALSKQYEFIDATLTENISANNKLNISIALADAEKFYVEKINIYGNSFTLEEVIRNDFIVDEGDPFNTILFNKSINKIKSRNIFASVDSKISKGSTSNVKIIDLTVVEKPTGEISLGAGVGTSGGSIGGGIKENNFLGKGIKLNTDLKVTKNSVKGSFVYEKPNFNYSDNSLIMSLNSTSTDNLTDFGYKTSDLGFSIGTSFQQYENLYFSPMLSAAYENLETDSTASASIKKQEGNFFDTYFNYKLDYDLRNKRYRPDEGFRNVFRQEIPLISEGNEFLNSFETTRYQKFSDTITKISFFGKVVNTIGDDDVRISKRLFMPASKLRGFEAGKIGPFQNRNFIGGNYISAFNFNATLPQVLPSFQNLDLSLFVDAANVWGVDYDKSLDDGSKIRSATGLALDILTPIGPLNFTFAHPITKSSTDETETFRFNLGTTF